MSRFISSKPVILHSVTFPESLKSQKSPSRKLTASAPRRRRRIMSKTHFSGDAVIRTSGCTIGSFSSVLEIITAPECPSNPVHASALTKSLHHSVKVEWVLYFVLTTPSFNGRWL